MAAPINDNFAAATLLTGDAGSIVGTTVEATIEAGEVGGAGYYGPGNTVWYRWTPSISMKAALTIDTFTGLGYGAYTAIEVYTGTAIGALTQVAGTSSFGFIGNVTGGTEYRIRLRAIYADIYVGQFTFHWVELIPPVNDNFSNAIILTGESGTVSATTRGASREAGEPAAHNNGDTSIWYKWTAPTNMYLRLNWTFTYNTIIDVWTGNSIGALTFLNSGYYLLEFQATSGITYYWRVDSYDPGAGGPFTLNWVRFYPPANNNLEDATVINGASGSIAGTTIDATVEIGEPPWEDRPGANETDIFHSTWYKWTAPSTGLVTFDTAGSNTSYTPKLEIFAGTDIGSLVRLAWNEFALVDQTPRIYPYWSKVILWAEVERTYLVRVSAPSVNGASTTVLNWYPTPTRSIAPFDPVPSRIWAVGWCIGEPDENRLIIMEIGPDDSDWRKIGYMEVDGQIDATDWNFPEFYTGMAHDPINNRNSVWHIDHTQYGDPAPVGNIAQWYTETVLPHVDGDPEDIGRVVKGILFNPDDINDNFHNMSQFLWQDGSIWYMTLTYDQAIPGYVSWLQERDSTTGTLLSSRNIGVAVGAWDLTPDGAAVVLVRQTIVNSQVTNTRLVRWDLTSNSETVLVPNLATTYPHWMGTEGYYLWINELRFRPNGELAVVIDQNSTDENGHYFSVLTSDGSSIIREFHHPPNTHRIYAWNYDPVADGWWTSDFGTPGVNYSGVNNAVVVGGVSFIDANTVLEQRLPTPPADSYQTYEIDWLAFVAAPSCAPPNDNWADAEVLIGDNGGPIAGTNVCATTEVDEPSMADWGGTASVWYSWTPSIEGTGSVTLAGDPDYRMITMVFTGEDLTTLEGPVGIGGDVTYWSVTGITTYYIRIFTRDPNPWGLTDPLPFTLTWDVVPCVPPSNDNWANAQILMGNNGSIEGNTICASEEPNEPGFI